VSEIRLRFRVIVSKLVLVRVAEIKATPAGTECGSIFKVIPPEELEDGFEILLFFEHPRRKKKRKR
jgi:hypothetical protein